jgi:hypothetical protein
MNSSWNRIVGFGLATIGCWLLAGCASDPELNQSIQASCSIEQCPPIVMSGSCTLQPPLTGSYWTFTQSVTFYAYGVARPDHDTSSTIQWDTQGASIPPTENSGVLRGDSASWTYSLTLLNGTIVTNTASVSSNGSQMTGTAANGAQCTATLAVEN